MQFYFRRPITECQKPLISEDNLSFSFSSAKICNLMYNWSRSIKMYWKTVFFLYSMNAKIPCLSCHKMQYLRAIIEISVYENLPNLESYRIFQSKSNWLYQFLNVFKLEYSRILFKNLKLFKYGEVDSFSRLDSTCPIFSKFLPSFLIHFRPKWIRKLGKNLEKIGQVLKTA